MKRGFGDHVMLELYGCLPNTLVDLNIIFNFLDELPSKIGMTKISQPYCFFYRGDIPEDWGISGTVILSQSHGTIHTFPDRGGFATIDIYSCNKIDQEIVLKEAYKVFSPIDHDIELKERGGKFIR